jgi:hypothetical protein
MITVTSPFEAALKKEEERHWTATPKQQRFLELPFEEDEAGYGGSLGSGKSDVLMILPLALGLHEQPKYKGLFLRRTFPELESEIIPRSQEYFPSTGAVYNEQKHRWKFPKGGFDIFGHLKDEKDVKKYDTLQATCIRWDEATSFTGFQYEYLTLRRGRVPPGYPYPTITRWGSNPGNVGHTYFRKRFLDPYKNKGIAFGSKILKDPKTGTTMCFIPATAEDNKHLLEANPNYYKKLEGISSEAERRAMILGDWYVFEGQVFEEFRLEPLPDEPENARHVIESFPIPDWWPRLISIDWGFAAFCFVIWWAISPDGRVYIYRTYAVKKAKIKQWTRDICLLTGPEINQVRDIRICWSAVQDTGQDQTILEQVADAISEAGFSCGLTKGEKNRISGKQLVHEYLRWKPLPSVKSIIGDYDMELARRIERMHGSEALKRYTDYFIPEEPEYNLPKLQIMLRSPEGRENSELIECIPSCVYDETKKEDVKEFSGDDPYDCVRIGLYAVRDYFAESKGEYDKRQRIGLAAKKLADTGDQTAYYRMCEAIEAVEKDTFSVRRKSFRSSRMSRMSRSTRMLTH